MTRVYIRERQSEPRHKQEKRRQTKEDKAVSQRRCSPKSRNVNSHQEVEEAKTGLSPGASRGSAPLLTPLIWTSGPQNSKEMNFRCLKPSIHGNLSQQLQETGRAGVAADPASAPWKEQTWEPTLGPGAVGGASYWLQDRSICPALPPGTFWSPRPTTIFPFFCPLLGYSLACIVWVCKQVPCGPHPQEESM